MAENVYNWKHQTLRTSTSISTPLTSPANIWISISDSQILQQARDMYSHPSHLVTSAQVFLLDSSIWVYHHHIQKNCTSKLTVSAWGWFLWAPEQDAGHIKFCKKLINHSISCARKDHSASSTGDFSSLFVGPARIKRTCTVKWVHTGLLPHAHESAAFTADKYLWKQDIWFL